MPNSREVEFTQNMGRIFDAMLPKIVVKSDIFIDKFISVFLFENKMCLIEWIFVLPSKFRIKNSLILDNNSQLDNVANTF